MTTDERRGLIYGLIVGGSFVAIDIAIGNRAAISSSYALGAIVGGVLGGARVALPIGVLAVMASALSGFWNDDFGTGGYWGRLFVCAAGALLAVGAGRLRDQVADQLGRQQMLMAVADLPTPGATLEQTVARVTELLVPGYATFAAIDAASGGETVRIGLRGSEPVDPADVNATPLRARGHVIGTLATAGGRGGADDPEFLRVFAGRVALALDNAGLSQELLSVEQQLQAILENLGEAVTVQERSGRLVFANRAAAELLGAESVEELLSTPTSDLVERFTTVTEDGAPLDVSKLPGRLVLEGVDADPLVVRATNKQTGEERWRVTKSTAVNGPGGEVVMAVNVIEDITDAKRTEMAQRLLADASSVLASSLDATQMLREVAELAVPVLADWCAATLTDGTTAEVVAVVGDADVAELLREPTLEVLRSGQPLLLPTTGDGAAVRSAVVAPMVAPERIVGALAFATRGLGRRFARADVDLALELARRAATAIENARLYNQLEYVATTLQRSLLPPALPDVPGWSFRSLYLPAGGEADVGGDFYDVFPTAAGWMALMGDVVGRGPAAASLTAMARYTLRTAGSLAGTPTMGMARLNENLRQRGDMALCTAAVALLRDDGSEATLVCAGHPLPYLIRDGEVQQVGRIGPLLGAFDRGHWLAASVPLEDGDVLVMYTDGVTDARGADGRFGEERLAETLTSVRSADDAVERIRAALREFAGAEQDDDTAVLAMQREVRSAAGES